MSEPGNQRNSCRCSHEDIASGHEIWRHLAMPSFRSGPVRRGTVALFSPRADVSRFDVYSVYHSLRVVLHDHSESCTLLALLTLNVGLRSKSVFAFPSETFLLCLFFEALFVSMQRVAVLILPDRLPSQRMIDWAQSLDTGRAVLDTVKCYSRRSKPKTSSKRCPVQPRQGWRGVPFAQPIRHRYVICP